MRGLSRHGDSERVAGRFAHVRRVVVHAQDGHRAILGHVDRQRVLKGVGVERQLVPRVSHHQRALGHARRLAAEADHQQRIAARAPHAHVHADRGACHHVQCNRVRIPREHKP
eukprot:scaffold3899_cov106-Isochrysis_galbana.AAC.3